MSQNNPAAGGGASEQAAQEGNAGGGNGNGDLPSVPARLANRWEIGVAALFLVGLTLYLLYGITTRWPACELPDDAAASQSRSANQNANRNTNANQPVNANQNTNANAGTNANVNAPASPAPAAAAPTATLANRNQSGPVLMAVEPASGSIKGGRTVIIRGSGLSQDYDIRFDQKRADFVGEGGGSTVTVKTPSHEEGLVDVTIHRGDTLLNRLPGGYTYVCPAPTGTNLFLMLIMAGAPGGCIHAMRSLWWYAGNEELRAPWLPMYFLLPFIGASMATIFSFLIVAGIVDNTTGRNTSLFIIAIAGLVGMFSQQAALKLTDIANAFFTKPGPGKDSKPQESQSVGERGAGTAASTGSATPKISPTSGPAAGNTPVSITGTGFTDVTQVLFDTVPSTTAPAVSADKSVINATAPPHAAGVVTVTVTNQAGAVKTFQYKYN